MATMKTIAKAAGVSIQTVSNVINKRKSQISEDTRKKILKLIEEFHYKPNKIARSLRRGRTRNIGLVVPDMVFHPYYPKIFDIIESSLLDKGYNLLVFNTRENIDRENRAVNELLEIKVDGIIFIRIIQKNDYLKILSTDIPIVACLRDFNYFKVPSVLTDNEKIGYLATNYLLEKGHRNIIHFAGNEELLAHKERKSGYLRALETSGINVRKDYIKTCDYKGQDLFNEILPVLHKIKDFTAVFAYNDLVAMHCMKALRLMGRTIPDDVSVIGVDNLNCGELVEPSLTTIEQPVEEICELSIQLLVNAIENKIEYHEGSENTVLFEPKLIERESVKVI
jgi:LacI family transcriptional regulator